MTALAIRRLKRGLNVEHSIAGDELRAIKRYMASRTDALPWLFISERGQPFTRQSVNYLIAEAAARVGLPPTHPHMLRHSCGFSLANRGYDLHRAGLGALRTRPSLAKGKFFTSSAALSAKLFTAGAADEEGFAVALLPRQ